MKDLLEKEKTKLTKPRAPRNRTQTLTSEERALYGKRLLTLEHPIFVDEVLDKTICQDMMDAVAFLPRQFVDLLFVDPPYNLDKSFNGRRFAKHPTQAAYLDYLESWFVPLLKTLRPGASIYICSDWNACGAVQLFAEKYFKVRNRITWEREKGRGAKTNWKNCSEDIWFCTLSDDYTFNIEAVKLKRKVIAPYTCEKGRPKDWKKEAGGNFRITHPSNIWTDLTVPFWSMPENTDHPTQKPEKLLAKIILASSNPGDVVLDPFLGSGTTSVVAKKLNRHYVGIEIDRAYACVAEKRLEMAEKDKAIQGYTDGVFWERNTPQNTNGAQSKRSENSSSMLF
ncbi:MAG TPA: site-specific DNA-methyltransferase [bacterium]|nr:site-specific DNA-methyltransferase [bacterium]